MTAVTPGTTRRQAAESVARELLSGGFRPSRRQVVDAICKEARAKHVACPRWRARAMLKVAERAVRQARITGQDYVIRRPVFWAVHPVMDAVMIDDVRNPPEGSAHAAIHASILEGGEFALIHTKNHAGACVLQVGKLSLQTIPVQAG